MHIVRVVFQVVTDVTVHDALAHIDNHFFLGLVGPCGEGLAHPIDTILDAGSSGLVSVVAVIDDGAMAPKPSPLAMGGDSLAMTLGCVFIEDFDVLGFGPTPLRPEHTLVPVRVYEVSACLIVTSTQRHVV